MGLQSRTFKPARSPAGGMDRTVLRRSLAVGLLAALVAAAYGLGTDLARPPDATGLPFARAFVWAALVAVPFAVAGGAALLALRHRVVMPLAVVVAVAAVPAVGGWQAPRVLVGVLVGGPLAVVVALGETVVRARLRRLQRPPSAATFRAISVGTTAAVVYAGVFAVRAAVPQWRLDAGGLVPLAPTAELAVMVWYALGASLVLVGVPVASNRRYRLVAPLVGLAGYLLVDLAYVQPLVADGAVPVVVPFLVVWPLLSVGLAGTGPVEWWIRDRRGEYEVEREGGDSEEGDGEEGDGEGRYSVETGLFGDRV